MPSAEDLGRLDPADWERLQDLADRFEEAWQSGGPANLGDHLPPTADPLRRAALVELIKIDLELRRRHNCPIALEAYLKLFPDLGPAPTLTPSLIYEEYCVRTRYGDKPSLTEYQSRFPQQFSQVLEMVHEQSASGGERAVPTQNVRPRDTLSELLIPGGMGYRFIEKIGKGTFGEVYRGEAPGGIPVAIKRIYKPIDSDEAQCEYQALELIKNLRHPFLLATQAYWVSGSHLFVVMELANGNLRGRLDECRREDRRGLPVGELLGYVTQAAQAIDFLHSRQVLHNDIKPENILLMQGYAKLSDFGLASGLVPETEFTSDSGTPRYMAPETWNGRSAAASDQYSLALCFAELRQDRFPFPGQTRSEIRKDHLDAAPELPGLADDERRVVLRALAKDPGQRFENCQAFVDALRKALCQGADLLADFPQACEYPFGGRIVRGPRDGPD